MTKPYYTKFAYGRWYFYRDTRRKWKHRWYKIGWWYLIIASYRKVK